MRSSTSPISVRILLLSTGVISAAMALTSCFPTPLNFAVYDLPLIWSVILSWLQPPYLYFVINGIIICIAASSRYHHDNQSQPLINDETKSPPSGDLPSESPPPVSVKPSFDALEQPVKDLDVVTSESEGKFARNPSVDFLPAVKVRSDFTFPVKEKPLVSSRFAHQRKLGKINLEGVRSLRVAKPRKHETLESTWKTITEGRHMPLNRHLRKPDILENHYNHAPPSDICYGEQGLTDYNQNHGRLSSKNSLPPSGGKLRKEGSLSCDELNRRVEAFIKKVNEDMRLERQESLKRYMDMINRG